MSRHKDGLNRPQLAQAAATIRSLQREKQLRASQLEQLQYSGMRYRNVFEHIPVMVCVWRVSEDAAESVLVDINPSGLRYLDGPLESPVGQTLRHLMPSLADSPFAEALLHVWQNEETYEIPVLRHGEDGTVRYWRCIFCRLPSGDVIAISEDVTQAQETGAALSTSERGYRTLVENIPDIVARFDVRGRLLFANSALRLFARGKRLPRGHGTGQPLGQQPMMLRELRERVQLALSSGMAQSVELEERTRQGRRVFEWRLVPEPAPDGEPGTVLCIGRDVSAMRRATEDYRAIFNGMISAFALHEIICDAAGNPVDYRFLAVNPAFERMTGLNAADVVGRTALSVLPGLEAEWLQRYGQVARTGVPVTFEAYNADLQRHFKVSAYSPGERQFACMFYDISDRLRGREERRSNARRMAALQRLFRMKGPEDSVALYALEQSIQLTGSRAGRVVLYDPETRNVRHTLTCAPGWVHAAGLADPQADGGALARPAGDDRGDGIPDDSAWGVDDRPDGSAVPLASGKSGLALAMEKRLDDLVQRTSKSMGQHVSDPVQDREGPYARHLAVPVRLDGRLGAVAVLVDKPTPFNRGDAKQVDLLMRGMLEHLERRRSMQRLAHAKEHAESASRAKSEFLANMSHELRTPLNGMLGMLQLLEVGNLDAEQHEFVQTALDSGRTLLRVLSDILDLSRIEAGRMELHHDRFSPDEAVRQVHGMFVQDARLRGLRLDVSCGDLPCEVWGDGTRLRQILFNLVGNAMKFTHTGSVKVEACTAGVGRDGTRLLFSVTDTGIGIPEDRLMSIFEPFTQLDGSSTRRYSGTGLGLSIVRRLVGLMGGTLAVESVFGEGTAVHVCLPFRLPVAQPRVCQTSKEVLAVQRRLRVLIAEDEEVNRMTLTRCLRHLGHDSTCVTTGLEAVTKMRGGGFDCILMDIQMPELDGLEALRLIREEAAKVGRDIPPVVALTAHAMEGDRERFLAAGMDAYIPKPIDLGELESVLRRLTGD